MSGAFQYRPKFVDIRVRPPKAGEEEAPRVDDVLHLKPGEHRCEWSGCTLKASARAPKSREMMNEHYWFCQAHAGEYNRKWDFFAGMTEGQMAAAQAARATGDRPTWQFKASRMSREAAAFAAKMGGGVNGGKGAGAYADPLGVFGQVHARRAAEEPSARRVGRLERKALEELDLDERADGAAIRVRYLELVKRFHPDSNGGDRSTEQKLTKVLKAYKTLKASKLV
jgi:hypothetical protein